MNCKDYSTSTATAFSVTASLDPETQKSVIAFQQMHKLRANGKVGTITWTLLRGKPLPPPPKQPNWL
ncbi:MAG: peptidoglycan-binding protein [Phormidesmis sp. CAN_BIN44]|nr:peptidoglycan-binding protein [Phormidesmis sp. CAN_BIN44]